MQQPIFKLSLISLALFGGMAYAADETAQPAQELQTIRVKGEPSTRRITVKNMNETTDTQLRDVLKNEASVSMGAGAGTSQYLFIRGMGQNSVDVKVNNAYSDSQIHYHQGRHMLDPALVKIVAVQKGAGSASAGIGQTNGAIVAKTLDAADLLKNSSNPNFGAKINAGYSSNDGHNYGLALFGQSGMFDYLLAGNIVKENAYKGGKGYVSPLNGSNKVPYSALDKGSYLAKIGATVDNHRFVLSHMHEQHKGTRLVREEFTFNPSGLTLARQAPAERKMSVDLTNFEWTAKDLGFAQSATANIYRLEHGRWSANDSGNGYAGGNRNVGSTKTKAETIGANVNFDSQITDKVLLKYGLNYRNQKIKPNQIFIAGLVHQQKQDVGVYAEAITDVTDKLTLTTGLRYDHFSFKDMSGRKLNDGAINPSISAIYQVTPELSFNVLHNYATRSPRMHDALLSHGARGTITIANNTKAERAQNTEIGFAYRAQNYGFEGAYFWQNIKDALGTTTARNNHSDKDQEIINAGKVKNKGYELSGYYRWNNLTARLGVAHSKPKFYGENLAGKPEYASVIGRTWTAGLSYRFANPNVEIGIQHRQVEKVKASDNYFLVNNTVKPATTGKAGYGVTDITANWKPFNNDKMNVNFAVNNIGNKNYKPHSQRDISTLPGAGREFRVGVNYTF
ncbi:TonB-dependent receptor domain-containing protein [Kingella kingae]|uniref:Ferric enterobactin receptor n=2 Tax=Kingella kingae TaxID=504 RepID=F5S615_KINKI|nr:TonB-dependent receptor [Kingella kingae]EGK10494.1 ferric enterobactin receptor [Kingella kingae ATCC 23330]UOP03850.1 TonB-dependent receptor [Kingella kingae]SQH25084.1 Heme/hemopexin utilization protein C precursor [Kingella kingae]